MVGALYPGTERGLATDVLAARALDLLPQVVCTAIVAAGGGRVTDVVEVPADTVDAQLEHVLATSRIAAAKIGVVGSASSADVIFRRLERLTLDSLILDLKLSGPSGEDIADGRTIEVLKDNFNRANLISVGRMDAELLTSMKIESLDDAQVAAQRMEKLGARSILLRCGRLPARFFETPARFDETRAESDFYADLFYDGNDFALFEAPYIPKSLAEGASSGLALSIMKNLSLRRPLIEAIQQGKAYVTEAIRHTNFGNEPTCTNFFWNQA